MEEARWRAVCPGNASTSAQDSWQVLTCEGQTCSLRFVGHLPDISIGYIATDRILGLYKFARITHKYAHQLQLQEQLYKEIADEIVMLAKSTDVAILAQEQHFCMTARGIKTPAIMTSSIMRGVFGEKHEARMEFLRLTERSHI
jgi:GTP cyclohydrolase I